jgi:hypothetical protein
VPEDLEEAIHEEQATNALDTTDAVPSKRRGRRVHAKRTKAATPPEGPGFLADVAQEGTPTEVAAPTGAAGAEAPAGGPVGPVAAAPRQTTGSQHRYVTGVRKVEKKKGGKKKGDQKRGKRQVQKGEG